MKAFLLAAGHGTRLRPLTDRIPKCLIPIQGTPLLEIWLNLCSRLGIDEVLVNLHAHADLVNRFLNTRSYGLRVQVSEETTLLGSAGTLLANRKWVEQEEAFWIFYADVLTAARLDAMLAFHRARGPVATLGVYEVPDPHRCGIVIADEAGIIQRFVEKPAVPDSNLAFSGLMIAGPELLKAIPSELPADLGFHVLPRLVGRMAAYRINEYLADVGTMERYQAAQRDWPGL